MNDQTKTNAELIKEISVLKQRIRELEKSESDRKQAEEALREGEERYRTFINATSDMVFLKDELFRNIVVNKSLATFFGKPEGEIIGKSDFELMPQIAAEKCRQTDLEALSNQSIFISEEIVGDQWYETLKFPVELGHNRVGVGGFIRNTTERKRAEEALQASEENFRRSLDESPLGIRIATAAGETIYANQAILNNYGYDSIEELKTTPVKKRYTSESYAEFLIRREKRKRGNYHPSEYEISIVRKNSEVRHLQVSRKEILWNGERQFQVIYQDITERKRAEEALKKSEEMLRVIAENMSDMIRVADLQGNNLFVSPSHFKGLGYKQEERIGKSGFDIVHPGDVEKIIDVFSEGLASNRVIKVEYRVKHADGRYLWLETIGDLLRDAQGKATAVVMSSRDITERKRMDEKLRDSEKRYRELSIVDDLTQLYNSRYFYDQLKMEIARVDRHGQPLTLLLLDLDDFKEFNDTYGHIEGDKVLSRIGNVVKRCLRQTDSAYRYGGEEFTIILPMTTSKDAAVTAERIRTEFKKETFSPAPCQDVHLTMSIGLAQCKPQEDMKAFVTRVDQLMYQAKKNGKDRVCVAPFPAGMEG